MGVDLNSNIPPTLPEGQAVSPPTEPKVPSKPVDGNAKPPEKQDLSEQPNDQPSIQDWEKAFQDLQTQGPKSSSDDPLAHGPDDHPLTEETRHERPSLFDSAKSPQKTEAETPQPQLISEAPPPPPEQQVCEDKYTERKNEAQETKEKFASLLQCRDDSKARLLDEREAANRQRNKEVSHETLQAALGKMVAKKEKAEAEKRDERLVDTNKSQDGAVLSKKETAQRGFQPSRGTKPNAKDSTVTAKAESEGTDLGNKNKKGVPAQKSPTKQPGKQTVLAKTAPDSSKKEVAEKGKEHEIAETTGEHLVEPSSKNVEQAKQAVIAHLPADVREANKKKAEERKNPLTAVFTRVWNAHKKPASTAVKAGAESVHEGTDSEELASVEEHEGGLFDGKKQKTSFRTEVLSSYKGLYEGRNEAGVAVAISPDAANGEMSYAAYGSKEYEERQNKLGKLYQSRSTGFSTHDDPEMKVTAYFSHWVPEVAKNTMARRQGIEFGKGSMRA